MAGGPHHPRVPVGLSSLHAVGKKGAIEIQDEGVQVVAKCDMINFVGTSVQADPSGVSGAIIYIPAPAYASHFNTTDGTTTGTVSESITRTTAYISTPTSEGNPFSTGGTAGTSAPATAATSVSFTVGGEVTGFGGNSTLTVTVYDANGTSVLETVTTASIAANGSYGSGNITITISDYAADTNRFKATPSFTVAIGTILTAAGREGGRYHVAISMTTDSTSDGTGPYTYTQAAVFLDSNPATPSATGTTIAETGGSVVTKHLSGIEYYTTGSDFTVAIADIDNLNRNTAKTTGALSIAAANYGVSSFSQSPLPAGAGNGSFTGWTSSYNIQNVSYSNAAVAINQSNFRYRGTGAAASATPADPWGSGSAATSSSSSILVDTYSTSAASDLAEDFDNEARRQTSTYNGGSTSGNWTSTNALSAGEALVMGGAMLVPSQASLTSGGSNADWSSYAPDDGGANPNYSSLGAPVSYYRTIVDTAGTDRSSFSMSFTGSFVSNATADLAAQNLRIFIRRRASANGGGAGTGADPLLLHGALYNFATFDDGATNGQIREATSNGNTVYGTFGGFTCETGFFVQVEIVNTSIQIDRFAVTFY